MAARTGMADLIGKLRGLCDAGTADYTVDADTYWSDEQIEAVLDGYRFDHKREPLMVSPDAVVGSTEYHDYYFQHEHAEGTASGTTAWVLEDSTGADVAGSLYTPNVPAQQVRFTANTLGTAYYLSYRSFDLERAAAELWETKAGHAHSRFDLKIDNHDMKRSQIAATCLKMAAVYRRRAKAGQVRRVRSDVNGGW